MLTSIPVSADIGPKPTVNIAVSYDNEPVSNFFLARLLACYEQSSPDNCDYFENDDELINYFIRVQNDIKENPFKKYCEESPIFKTPENIGGKLCYWSLAPLAWGGDCRNSNCGFWYSIPDNFRVMVYFPSLDRVFVSNEVSNKNFNSKYQLDILSEGSANIYETTSFLENDMVLLFIQALIITLILELLIGYVFLRKLREYKRILGTIVIANIISLSIVWLIVDSIGVSALSITLPVSELFVMFFETYFIYFLNKKLISLKKSFKVSVVMNLFSLFIGGLILIFLQMSAWFF